ncbi:MAG TPA: protein kinase [Polyangiaceae bacterium]|nr:protein kinase [Polyangiaceae bacterium]
MATPHLTVSAEERTRLARTRLGQLVLGKWRLDRLIGVGGMAAVFEATHRNGNRVALKMLHPDLTGFDEIRERFLAEGYAANRVSHPGVVTVRDEGTTEDGAVFLVMDLLRGQTLAERLEDGRELFSVGEVLEISSQLLDVLVHAHHRGIVHRDIKPENVFLTADKRVRLLDFGIARVENQSRTHTTQVGTTLGTPAFMPPEQALGRWEELDGRSDLWSLGATMYLLLSGTPVREHGSVTEQLLGAMTRPVPSLGDVTALPRSVVAVVDRALAFDRDARFPDARSMQLAVRAVQDELSMPDSRTTLPPPSLEPTALSLRTPRPEGRNKRPSIPTVRPVAATVTPLPSAGGEQSRSALPVYIGLGFAVGISIVIGARFSVRPPSEKAPAAQATPGESAPVTAKAPPPPLASSVTTSPAAAPSVPSARRLPLRVPTKASSDPLSRRK